MRSEGPFLDLTGGDADGKRAGSVKAVDGDDCKVCWMRTISQQNWADRLPGSLRATTVPGLRPLRPQTAPQVTAER